MDVRNIIRKWALYNAILHDGKADLKAVISKVIGENPELRKNIKEIIEMAKEIISEINKLSLDLQKELLMNLAPELLEKKKEEKSDLKPLPNAEEGKVVLRMAPGITGYPHIGHAYAFLLNYLYSLKYKGKFVVRYEDTDPRLARLEYYDAWDEFIDFFDIKYSEKKIISKDFIDVLYDYGKKLIEKGYAYVCLKPKEEIRKARLLGKELEDRNRDPQENLELFDKMLNNEFGEGEAVVLLKGDMKSKNTRMRDPTIFRIVNHSHPLVGDKYVVWPSYDFAAAVCDGLQNVTHIIRSIEFAPARELQEYIRKLLGMRNIITIETSRINIKGNITSKRKIRKLIEEGKVFGWDDPRLVTIKGLRRRGIVKETFYEFVRKIGITRAQPDIDFSIIASINRKILDPKVKRLFAVFDWVELIIENLEEGEVKIPWHPDRKEYGERILKYSNEFYVPREVLKYEEFRLLHLANVRVKEVNEKIYAEFVGNEIIKSMPKVQWVPKGYERWYEVWIIDDLVKNGEYNDKSLTVLKVPVENNADLIKVDEIVQFERVGFARKDSKNRFIFSHK